MTRMPPLWRRAPLRGLRSRGTGLLVAFSLAVACACAASGPVFADLVGQSSLASVLASVPPGSRISDAPSLRLVSGLAPTSEYQTAYVNLIAHIPGLTPPSTSAVSVGPETHSGMAFRPLVRSASGEVGARIAAVESPASSLVVVDQVGGQGVWLPQPVAEKLGVGAGDPVSLLVATSYADEVVPPSEEPPATVGVRVAGVYAVAGDGRTPADLPGRTDWALRSGGIPSDSDLVSRRALLVIADVPLAETLAAGVGDDLLWSVESRLVDGLTLDEARSAAAGVTRLREEVRSPQETPVGPLRAGVVSGIDSLVARSAALADASTERAALLATTGTVAGLLALLALLVLTAVERRTETRHGAAVGVGTGPQAGLWALETTVPAFAAGVVGLLVAVGVTSAVGPDGVLTPATWGPAALRAGLVALVGVLLAAAVGALAAAAATRPHAPSTRRVPWIVLLVAVAAVATVAAMSTPSSRPGPLGLAVPALVSAATGAVLALVTARLLRRRAGRSSSLPDRPGRAGRWLAVRRVARAGDEQVVTVAVMALGLGMILFATSGAQATASVVEDRAAVVAGARTTAVIEGAWLLDPDMPRIPTVEEIEAGKPLPAATTPATPDGSMMLWRELISVQGTFGYHDLLVADPQRLDQVASWGSGQGLADARAALAVLADADARGATSPIPVIAVGTSDLAVGDVVEVNAQAWTESVKVVAVVDTFPGVRPRPMLVTTEKAALPTIARWDPRLAPSTSPTPPRPYFETWIWSTADAASTTAALSAAGAPASEVHSLEEAQTAPLLVAASTTLPYQGALAVFLAFLAIVMAVVHGRRSRDRTRASDVMLARSGLGGRGLAAARRTELVLLVLTAGVAAVLAVLAVVPLGPLLLDLDRSAQPGFALRVTPLGLAALVVVGIAMVLAAWPRRQGSRDEEVLRAAD